MRSRLDSGPDPFSESRRYVEKLATGGRFDSLFLRVGAFLKPDVPVAALADRTLSSDPVLAKWVFALFAQRARRQGQEPLSSARQAVGVWGTETVRRTILAGSYHLLGERLLPPTTRSHSAFLSQAITAGTAAALLAERAGCAEPAEAYSAGLMVRFGSLLLGSMHEDRYESMWRSLAGGTASLEEAERLAFGVDHLEVGAQAAATLRYPSFVSTVLKSLAVSLGLQKGLPLCVGAGSAIAQTLGFDGGMAAVPPEIPQVVLDRLNLNEAAIAQLAMDLSECSQAADLARAA